MSETIDRGPAADARPPRWSRTLTICTLLALSLAPGLAAAAAREWWHQLPAAVRLSTYILSGIFLVAACSLMLMQDDANRGDTET